MSVGERGLRAARGFVGNGRFLTWTSRRDRFSAVDVRRYCGPAAQAIE